MKSIISKSILILATGFLFKSELNATNIGNPKTVEIVSTSSFIKEHVTFPDVIFNFNQDEKVNVVFTIDEKGKVNLVIASTKNEKLKFAIETKFKTLTLANLKENNAYSIDLKFINQ
jgi:hypothetical protein